MVVEAQRAIVEVRDGFSFPFIEADVRVAEDLQGEPARIKQLKFQSTRWCGGHTLDVGRYYVVLLHKNEGQLTLGDETNAILGLGDEYDEQEGSKLSRSRLLLELRNFQHIGLVPDGFEVQPFLDLARTRREYPSLEHSR